MRKGNLLTMALVLSVLLAGVAIKSFGHASSSAPTRHANAIPTRADAAEARTPTMKIAPASAIHADAELFVGAGDGSAGSWIRP
jgi:hypothetical protein